MTTKRQFEVIFAKIIEADDFFDAVDIAKDEGLEVISVSEAPEDFDDDDYLL